MHTIVYKMHTIVYKMHTRFLAKQNVQKRLLCARRRVQDIQGKLS